MVSKLIGLIINFSFLTLVSLSKLLKKKKKKKKKKIKSALQYTHGWK